MAIIISAVAGAYVATNVVLLAVFVSKFREAANKTKGEAK